MAPTFTRLLRLSAITLFATSAVAQGCGTIYPDSNLQIAFGIGDSLSSCNGKFYVTYQPDFNAVVYYQREGQQLWNSETASLKLSQYFFQTTSANAGRMVMGDDGNLVVYTSDGAVDFSTNTQGTECTPGFITNNVKDKLAQLADSQDAKHAAAIRKDPCGLFNIEVTDEGISVEDIAADVAGSAVLKGKTIINEYKFTAKYFSDDGVTPLGSVVFPIGSARLSKTFFYDGHRVTNSAGRDPDKAATKGGVSDFARVLGWKYDGVQGGSEVDRYDPWNGSGEGAHISSRVVSIHWEVPIAGTFIAWQPVDPEELYVRVFANADKKAAECRGGTACTIRPLD